MVHRMVALSNDLSSSGTCPFGLEAADKGFEAFLATLFAEENAHRAESGAAVRRYIASGSWPEQSAWAQYITFLRVQCAAEFVCQLTAHDHSGVVLPTPHESSDGSVLTWLLVDHWERCFDMWLKLNAVSLFFSLPFYGLAPAVE